MRVASSSMRRIAVSRLGLVARRAHAEQLGVAADRGQRRAQLVRGVGEELAQALLAGLALGERLLEALEHRVQREAEPADLGARRRRADAAREVAGGDLARRSTAMRSSGRSPSRTTQKAQSAEREQHGGDHERLDEQQPVERLVDVAQRHGDDRHGRCPRGRGCASTR